MSGSNPYQPPQQDDQASEDDSRAEGIAFRAGGVVLMGFGGLGVAVWLIEMVATASWIMPIPVLNFLCIGGGVALWNRGTRSLYPDGTSEERSKKHELQQVVLSILEQHEVDESVELDSDYEGLPLKELVRIYETMNRDAYPDQTKKLIRALKARHEHALAVAQSRSVESPTSDS